MSVISTCQSIGALVALSGSQAVAVGGTTTAATAAVGRLVGWLWKKQKIPEADRNTKKRCETQSKLIHNCLYGSQLHDTAIKQNKATKRMPYFIILVCVSKNERTSYIVKLS